MTIEAIIVPVMTIWLMIGIINYGATYAYYQREYPNIADKNRTGDRGFATFIALLGPLGLIMIIDHNGFKHGFKYW